MAFPAVERIDGLVSGTMKYRVDFVRDLAQAASYPGVGGHRTIFQQGLWLDAWYDAFRDVSPLIAIVRDAETGGELARLPLIRRVQRGIRILEFADLGLTDYNAPILSAAAPTDVAGAREL